MLFLVPDDPPEKNDPENTPEPERREEEDHSRENVSLDNGFEPSDRGKEKVELDLDDAPFLDEDLEEDDSGKKQDEEQEREKEDKGDKKLAGAKRWWVLAAAVSLLLILIGAVVFFFFSGEKDAPSQSREPEKEAREKPEAKSRESIALEKFWIPHETENGTIFLNCRFALSTDNSKLAWEIDRKKLLLRDAIYYYLKNKELISLQNKENADRLKKDLLSVVNKHLSNGKLSDLLIEEYYIK
ncbi:MAG: flagellar basal body-associated protein FliL [Desulfonatronovibrionaceae bacterium]